MKKKLLFLLPFLLLSLSACDLSSLMNQGGNDDESSEKEENSEKLETNKEQSLNKLKEFGKTTGFDITGEVKTSNEEGESISAVEVGMKGDMAWMVSEGEYMGAIWNNESVTIFTSSNHGQSFQTNEIDSEALDGKTPEQYFDEYLETLTSWLYFSDTYQTLGLTKVKDLIYVGRNATEYMMSMSYGGMASVTYRAYIDKELEITLYWFGEAVSPEEGTDSSEFKVTSFKTGEQVVAPRVQ